MTGREEQKEVGKRDEREKEREEEENDGERKRGR